ncbi:MAG TPA: transporter substrate-binding domain-containing protein [Thermohalobaculum sp.]|nr:transporter substrate-binding domain-containing protein [Thermohalobaculum sp.]
MIRTESPKTARPPASGPANLARRVAALLAAIALLTVAAAAPAQEPLPCGTLYRVQPGDTLHSIAVRAYGEGNYLAIFEANRDILPNVTRIEVGTQLLIPCLDGSGPRTRAEILPAPGQAATPAPGVAETGRGGQVGDAAGDAADPLAALPADRELVLLTGPDFAPFVHPALPEGGLTTELVRLAFERAAPARSVRIVAAEDWRAHLDLLARGDADLGFPWYRPDCAMTGRLDKAMQRRCADFTFSAPLFELPIAWYTRAGDPLAGAQDAGALVGRRACRPASYFTFDLRQAGLSPPATTLVFPPSAEDCFVLLEAGVVDSVTLARPQAAAEIARLGLEGRVAEIPALASVQTLHAIAPKASLEARAILAALDAGLAELRESGRWFEVVARHLGPFGISLR